MIQLPNWLPFRKTKYKKRVYKYEFFDVHEYEGTDETHMGIRILEGPYVDLEYYYRKVQFSEDSENDRCHMKFEWFPIKNTPENDTQDLYDILGDILIDIIDTYGDNDTLPPFIESIGEQN